MLRQLVALIILLCAAVPAVAADCPIAPGPDGYVRPTTTSMACLTFFGALTEGADVTDHAGQVWHHDGHGWLWVPATVTPAPVASPEPVTDAAVFVPGTYYRWRDAEDTMFVLGVLLNRTGQSVVVVDWVCYAGKYVGPRAPQAFVWSAGSAAGWHAVSAPSCVE